MEVLIRAHERVRDTPEKQAEVLTRGDVIAIKPDGWAWTKRELTSPAWRIFRASNLTQAEVDALLGQELDPQRVRPVRWVRQYKLDLDSPALPVEVQAVIADDSRAVPILDMSGNRTLLNAVTVHRGRAMDRGK